MTTPLLAVRNLSVSIGGRRIVDRLSLDLQLGERLAILGRNGAGKTTLLHTLAGLHSHDAGVISLEGTPIAALGERETAQLRGLLAQHQRDAFPATVLETALVGRHPHLRRWQWEGARDERIAREALAAMQLADLATRDVRSLSGGERQRLAIATLLAQQPRLCLLDEPLAHLDLNHQMAVLELFSGMARDRTVAVITVLHDVNLALRYADRVLLLFGDGSWRGGPTAETLTTEVLTTLYGHPLHELRTGDQRYFLPQ
ncbi:MAG TPA: ABC transporter ATP-binding protein [Rhodocyclaceae bacterium]|nr:ABC transporter ATP-binding protein [Rhodocyclaceae bacterium]